MSDGIALRWGQATHTGMVRSANEDSLLVAEPVFAVADGMGGHAAGEVASAVAVDALRASVEPSVEGLVEAVRLANRAVWARADDEPDLRGMGTTLCAIALVPPSEEALELDPGAGPRVAVVNVGDSRVYLFRDGELDQLTDDHSLVEDLVRQGRLSPEEARTHPQRNILTRVLGNEPDVEVDWWEVLPYRGDRFLLCSDGLFNEVADDQIAAVLRRLADPADAASELVRLANEGGGRDNITVVLVDVVDDGGRAAAASAALAAEPGTAESRAPDEAGTTEAGEGDDVGEPDGGGGGPPAASAAVAGGAAEAPVRHRRVTWRSVLFVLAVVAVVGAGVAAVGWFARGAYFVGVEGDEVAIYRGRPGGLLWISPTLEERTGLRLDDVPVARREAVREGKEEPSLEAARRYVENLEEQAAAERPDATDRAGGDAPGATGEATTTTTRAGTSP